MAEGIDVFGASVVSQVPTGTVGGPVSEIDVTFSEAMDASSFGAADVTVTGPVGNVVELDATTPITDSGDHTTFTLNFASPQGLGGTYNVSIGPDVLDPSGNLMDQNADGIQGDGYSGGFEIEAVAVVPPVLEGFESGEIGGLGAYWSFNRTSGSISVSDTNPQAGTYALQMYDGSSHYSHSYYQDAVLHVDLYDNGAEVPLTDVTLDFWVKEYSGSSSDSYVHVSVDGTNWTQLEYITGSSSYQHYAYALDDLGLTYTDDVQIKFHHRSYYSGGFAWDDIRVAVKNPEVTSHTPIGLVRTPASSMRFYFDEPMDTNSFSIDDDVVSFTGPSGDLKAQLTGFSWQDGRTLDVVFNEQSAAGAYQMVIGPQILDMGGKPLDQDHDGTGGEQTDDEYAADFEIARIIYSANMDMDPGWTLDPGTPPYQWEYGVPTGSGGPTSGYTGSNVIAYNLSGNYPDGLNPPQYATMQVSDCSAYSNVSLTFRRWLAIESASYDHATVQVSNNGTDWGTVWSHTGGTFNDGRWVLCEYDISATADNQSTVYVRWGMGTTDGSATYTGWNIDDVYLTAQVCDLVMTEVDAPPFIGPGQQITVDRTYDVAWDSLVDDLTIGYYLSPDDIFDGMPGDYLVGTETITSPTDKAVGSHAGQSPALSVPGWFVEGSCHLFARIDDGEIIAEVDEANNVGAASCTLDTTAPTVSLAVPETVYDSTPSVVVSATDANGLPDGTEVVIDVDLNNDGDFDDADESGYTLSSLIGGEATFEITPALSDGTYTLRARVSDPAGNEGLSESRIVTVDTTPLVDLVLLPVLVPTSDTDGTPDTIAILPSPTVSVLAGNVFYLEVWIKDVGLPARGVSGGYLDISYDTTLVDATALSHGLYTSLTSGSMNDPAGLIDEFGGSYLPSGSERPGIGEYALLGRVTLSCTGVGETTFTPQESDDEFSRFSAGAVVWGQIAHSSVDVQQLPPSPDMRFVLLDSPTPELITTTLPDQAELHIVEDHAFYGEVWVKSNPDSPSNIGGGTVDLSFDPGYGQIVSVEPFNANWTDGAPGVIDPVGGTLTGVSRSTTSPSAGDDEWVLFARVEFLGNAPVDEVAHAFGPYDVNVSLTPGEFELSYGNHVAEVTAADDAQIYSVIYDVDDSGRVLGGDFGLFAGAYRGNVGDPEPPYYTWADFDGSGSVRGGDFGLFAGVYRQYTSNIDFSQIPERYRPAGWTSGASVRIFTVGGLGAGEVLTVTGGESGLPDGSKGSQGMALSTPPAAPVAVFQSVSELIAGAAPVVPIVSSPLDDNNANDDSIAATIPASAIDLLLVESPSEAGYIFGTQVISGGRPAPTLQRAATAEYDLRPLGDDLPAAGEADDLLADILAESALAVLPMGRVG